MAVNDKVSSVEMQEVVDGATDSGRLIDNNSALSGTADSSVSSVSALLPATASTTEATQFPRGEVEHKNVLSTGTKDVNDFHASPIVPDGTTNGKNWRFQVRLENGQFTPALRDALWRDLNTCLYSSPSSSFIPSFDGSGLRYGVVWFAPENEGSYNWVVEKLSAINEKAGDFRFVIEPFAVHLNKVCVNLPWDMKEGLRDVNVLKRLKFQNPAFPADRWKVVQSKMTPVGNKLLICCIDDASMSLLEKQNFRLNYGFHKVQVDVLNRKKPSNPSKK